MKNNEKREWFYREKPVARPVLSYDELCILIALVESHQKTTHVISTTLYSKLVRSKHLIEERRIKGEVK